MRLAANTNMAGLDNNEGADESLTLLSNHLIHGFGQGVDWAPP